MKIFIALISSVLLLWTDTGLAQVPDSLTISRSSTDQQEDPFIDYSNMKAVRYADLTKMAKGIDASADKYTGVVNVQVPIYEITTNAGKVPIALNYRTTGIRVEDVASEVGLGWELSAGGKITRIVRGQPDDFTVLKIVDETADNWNKDTFWDCVNNEWDTQPDTYYYSFPGGSGSFVFDLDRQPHTTPLQNHKIVYKNDEFTIYDSAGTKYTFTTKESTTEITGDKTTEYISSWFLDRIEYLSGTTLYYTYETGENYTTTSWNSLSRLLCLKNDEKISYDFTYGIDASTKYITHKPKYVASIHYMEQEIKFRYDTVRSDVNGMRRLKQMEIICDKIMFRTIKLNHSQFSDNSPKLISLIEQPQNNISKPICTFEYYEDVSLPAKNTSYKGFDHWGFYNTNVGKLNIFPDLSYLFNCKVDGLTWKFIEGTSRYPDLNFTRSQSLKKIIYPNGGSKEFIYDLHQGTNPKWHRSEHAGGLRIYEIIERASGDAHPARTWYEYTDGVIYDDEFNYIAEYGSIKGTDCFYLLLSSKSYSSPTDFLGCSVIYSAITEHLPNGSSIKYEYVPLEQYPDLNPEHFVIGDDIGRQIETGTRAPKTSRSWGRNILQTKEWFSVDKSVRKEIYSYQVDTANAVKIPFRILNSDARYYDLDMKDGRRYPFIDKNYHISCPVIPTKKVITAGSDILPSQTTYMYNSQYAPVGIIENGCDGTRTTKFVKYPFDYYTNQLTDKALVTLNERNAIVPIEMITYLNGKVVDATLNRYKVNPLSENSIVLSEILGLKYQQPLDSAALHRSRIISGAFYYDKTKYRTYCSIDEYDEAGNMLCYHDNNGIYHSQYYDGYRSTPIAYVENARHSVRTDGRVTQVFFNDFETHGVEYATAKSGNKVGNTMSSYVIDLSYFKTGTYVLSYWYKSSETSRWRLHRQEMDVTSLSTIYHVPIISEALYIDDMSLLPKNAVMTSECAIAPLGKISETDAQGRTTYYEYNKVGLPARVYDNDRTLIQENSYDNYGVDL